ncbi:hypothetical protein SMUE_08780 [Enterococcus cecorum]
MKTLRTRTKHCEKYTLKNVYLPIFQYIRLKILRKCKRLIKVGMVFAYIKV